MTKAIVKANTVANSGFASQYDLERNPLPPDAISMNHKKPVWWLCEANHSYEKSPKARSIECWHGTPCPICREEKKKERTDKLDSVEGAKKGRRLISLLERSPRLARQYSDKNPIPVNEISYGASDIVIWFDEGCGHEWLVGVRSRVRSGAGCAVCREQMMMSNPAKKEFYENKAKI